MLNRESEIYTSIKLELDKKFSGIKVVGEYLQQPPAFPCVYFFEESSTQSSRYYYGTRSPLFYNTSYQAQVFTTGTSKKQLAKKIMDVIREVMFKYGFRESLNEVLTNLDDSSISRRIGRWQGVIDQNHVYGG